jgi:type IV pilus assembly protein PilY1
VFYPRRAVGNDIVWWTGSLQNMWYFVDPFFANATIREDTDNNAVLHLANDYIVQFFFDPVSQLTQVRRFNSDNNGVLGTEITPPLSFEAIHSLWEAGKKLWQRSGSRTLYTNNIGGTLDTSSTMTVFSTGNSAQLIPYLLEPADNAVQTINYVHGIDNTTDPTMRSRTVTFGSDNNVWKLGDVVNSTPRIVASVPLNKYDSVYSDTTYTAFISDNNYKDRGMVFTGGNDGMLHAFRLGRLELSWSGKAQAEKARITDPFSSTLVTTLGDEQWGFIPENALPYLKYLKDPDYCHLYYTDLAPYVFDASIGSGSGDQSTQPRTQASWRTVLIGGMRTGGACANTCAAGSNCVQTPDTDKGFSSYFALDVTDPVNPSLLWEFTDPGLGFTTTGPAVIRINGLNASNDRDRSLNGEWYVVFGSGPTGPIDNTNNQFLGRSNQNLKFFVRNLKTGAEAQTIDTTIPNAFAGSMINSVADFNLDYQDDAIYVGYVKRAGSSGSYTWTDGGVGRILTANTTPGGANWKWSPVIDGVGPVTSSVARLQNNNFGTNWLFFGTGRYYFENPATGTDTTPEIDDPTGQRRLFGVKDPCFMGNTINPTTCVSASASSSVAFGSLTNVTSIGSVPVEGVANLAGFPGWFINMEGSGNYSYDNTAARLFRSERVITDPLATTSGVVFFTTYKPYGDECALGGKSFLWALRYNTGGAPSVAVMKGKALVQVSTASVEQIDLSKAFRAEFGGGMDGRRTAAIEGVPPTSQGLSLLSQPPPVKRIMHMMER